MIEKFKKLRPFLLFIMILLAWIGFYSFLTIPKESSPDVKIPFFSITAIYPGVDANTIEDQVTQKIEDKITSVKNISSFKSVSANNVAALTVEFKRWADKNTAYNDLKSAIDDAKVEIPDWVKVKLKSIDLLDIPVYTFSVVWNLYPSQLYDKVRFLEDDIKRISWVDKVEVIWKYIPEVHIKFDYEKLKKYKLSFQSIIWIVSQSISKQPVDKKELNWLLYSFEVKTYNLRSEECKEVRGENDIISKLECFKSQLENLPLINQNGNILRLKDIANVYVTHPFYKKEAFVDGKSAITYMVYKTPWTDMLKLVDKIKGYLKTKQAYFEKNNLKSVEISTRTIEIEKTYDTFISNFRQTALIILIVIFLFIGLKEAVWIFFAFPLVYLITFIILKAIWYTFNSIVSFSLVLTLWIMVDNLIVIIEWFEDGVKQWLKKYEAIAYSVSTYWKALVAWNLTTIAMFVPLSFMLSGKMGEFMKYLPTTINTTLVISLIVSLVFLPLILTYIFKDKPVLRDNWNSSENKVVNFVVWIISQILKHPKKVILWLWVLFFVVIFAFWKFWKVDFMPATDKNNIYVNITYDKSVNLQENKKMTEKIYKYVKDFMENCRWYENKEKCDKIVKNIQIKIWDYQTFAPLDRVIYFNGFNPDLATINISLIDSDDRPEKDNAVKIYPKLNAYLNSHITEFWWKIKEISVFIRKNGPSSWKDVWFYIAVNKSNLTWDNLKASEIQILANSYEKLLPKLKKIPWTYAWSSSLEYSNWKINIVYDMDKIRQFNLSVSDINLFLLSLYSDKWSYLWNWVNISKLNDFWKDIIPVKGYTMLNWDSKNIDLNSILIPGTNIYLWQVVKSIKLEPEIKYYKHLDGTLVLKIEAYKQPDVVLWDVTKQIEKIVSKDKNIKLYYAADIKDMKNSMKDLWMAFGVWILLMFAVLVLNFGNYKQPLIIFSALPLLFIWAFLLLMLAQIPFGFAAQLGMFGLIWVGVNNAILLIERYNELKMSQMRNSDEIRWEIKVNSKDEILKETVRSRIKPVFLTTLTTILWLITLAVKDALWGSLALSFMWWLMVWTIITLIYIPAMLKISKD